MSDNQNWRGIFAIPQSVYLENGNFDDAGLTTEVEYCVKAGAHGIVWPVMASQFSVLTHEERKRTAEIVINKVANRIPVVIGVATVWEATSVDLAQHAEANGAEAIISLPPWEVKPTREQAFEYYRALSDAVSLPIFVQNAGGKFGMAFPANDVARMVCELEHVEYVKEEVNPAGLNISKVLAACGDTVRGVFGGGGGKFLMNELDRGAAGNMPAVEMLDILCEIFDRYERGDHQGARDLHNLLLPYHTMHGLYGMGLNHLMLKRRGVIRSSKPRYGQNRPLDEHDERELEIILEKLKPHFRLLPP
ncbi:MAG: dihydrodipicolinate synthase family protein [bacterium]|nr:dihydrodipicolinate synthase family protein [bacterium]